MTRQGYLLAGGVMVLGLTFGAGYWQGQRSSAVATTQAENQANVAKVERDAFEAQAKAKDKTIESKDAAIMADKRSLARANAEIQRIKELPPIVINGPGTPDLRPVVERQKQLIDAYEVGKRSNEVYIKDLESKNFDLTCSRDLWKASTEAGKREAVGLRIALDLQKSLTKGALWKGRIQGLIVGLGSSYIAKRI